MSEITLQQFEELVAALESGQVRVAEKIDGVWKVNREVKEIILAGFRLGKICDMSQGQFPFFDKDIQRHISLNMFVYIYRNYNNVKSRIF